LPFGVVKLHIKSNQRAKSTPHRFNTRLPSQIPILFEAYERIEINKTIIKYLHYKFSKSQEGIVRAMYILKIRKCKNVGVAVYGAPSKNKT